MVMFFGWIFLLIRGAFSVRTSQCGDCESIEKYKTLGSRIALLVLIFLAFCVGVAVFEEVYHL